MVVIVVVVVVKVMFTRSYS